MDIIFEGGGYCIKHDQYYMAHVNECPICLGEYFWWLEQARRIRNKKRLLTGGQKILPFRAYTEKKHFCALGSVKTNIGHTATSAGVASVIKVLLSLKHKTIPPSLNFEKANEHINFDDSPFYVNTELTDWKTEDSAPLRAAVSSFGFSGTNAHVVLEEYPEKLRITNYELRIK